MRQRGVVLSVIVPAVMFLAAVPLLMSAPSDVEKACVEATEWAESNRSVLPTTLASFSELSLPYRRAAYAEMSVAMRKRLWYDHLMTFVGPSSDLTPEQQATVRFIAERLDRYILEDPSASRAALEKDGLTDARLLTEFGDAAPAILMTLGPTESLPGLPWCECSTESDWCGDNKCCGLAAGDDCKFKSTGCGTLWCYACDGLCYDEESGNCGGPS